MSSSGEWRCWYVGRMQGIVGNGWTLGLDEVWFPVNNHKFDILAWRRDRQRQHQFLWVKARDHALEQLLTGVPSSHRLDSNFHWNTSDHYTSQVHMLLPDQFSVTHKLPFKKEIKKYSLFIICEGGCVCTICVYGGQRTTVLSLFFPTTI